MTNPLLYITNATNCSGLSVSNSFQTKQEAERLKFTLGAQFEGVYLVKDEISESELLKMY